MEYNTLNNYSKETHPWEPYIPHNATKLILGSFPTAIKNRGSYEFFYPNQNNPMWKILFMVTGKNLTDFIKNDPIEIRKQILSELQMGIADMGKIVLRQLNSSKDNSLFPIEFTDIFSILDEHKAIKKIILTSSSGSNSVLAWFQEYCRTNNHNFNIPKGKLPKECVFLFKKRKIHIVVVPSTSLLSPVKGDRLLKIYSDTILR